MAKLLALLIALILAACASISDTDVKNDPAPEAPAVPVQTAPAPVRFTVETGVWENTACAEDGTALAEYSFTLPMLSVCREDGSVVETAETDAEQRALETAAVFNEKFGKWAAAEEFDEIVKDAAEHLEQCREWEIDWVGPYTLELECTVYQTEQMVSISGLHYRYTGGAHPNTYLLGWNFDLETGEFFDAKALSDGTALQDHVTEELIRLARCRASEEGMVPEQMFWEDYERIIADWSSCAVSFDESGMTVAFSPYELAAYAAGAQEFTLSYEELAPHLNQRGQQVLGLAE